MQKNKKRLVPKRFQTLEEAGKFWDTHDQGDYRDQTEEVAMSFRLKRKLHLFSIELAVARELHAAVKSQGVSPETIANLWLREMLAKDCSLRKRGRASRITAS